MDLCLAVHKLENFSSSPRKVHSEGLVHLLIYITDNKHSSLIYYSKIEGAPISDLLRKSNIKLENQLMMFSDSRWQECIYTGRCI